MIKMLDRVPIIVVVIDGSEDMTSPCNDQEILRGSSPVITEQLIWTYAPSSTVSDGNWNGAILGGSMEFGKFYNLI